MSKIKTPPQQVEADGWTSHASWMGGMSSRYFESAETTRLNEAHWTYAADESVNSWLSSKLSTIRARAAYECRQNGMLVGMINTHADDVVGQDGPTLQVLSDDDDYNDALEKLWRDWFSAPTPNPEISGAEVLKQWVRSLWKTGEYLGQLVTDTMADGEVKLRVKSLPPRLLETPAGMAGNSSVFMGIRFSSLGRPTQYYILDESLDGLQLGVSYTPVPADLVIHKFIVEEAGQLRGIPWLNTALSPSADLRDYDDQVQDAARQIADQNGILYTDHPDANPWLAPESVDVQRRMIRTAPPGWKPFVYPAAQPPVQYPEYRAERQREFGRPAGMPLATIRLDYGNYNYSSARLETQNYQRAVAGIQTWISGTDRSAGTLNRLVDALAAEARFLNPDLRNRPERVHYQWTWPQRPHVDPVKEAVAEKTALENRTITFADALASRGRDLETHLATLQREQEMLIDSGVILPEWMVGNLSEVVPDDDDDVESEDMDGVGDN